MPAGIPELEELVKRFISISVGLSFVALVVVLVIAGLRFLVSGGETKALQSARNAVTWAVLGIIFLVLAWLILQLIEALTGIKVTQFCISLSGCP